MKKYLSVSEKISHDEYLRLPSIGSSTMKLYAYAPYCVNMKQDSTPSMNLGTLFHSFLLENDKFDSEHFVSAHSDKRRSETKEEIELYKNLGITWVSSKEYVTLCKMREAVKQSPYSNKLLASGIAETSFFFEIDGVKCKARPDWVTKIGDTYFCVDLKTMSPKGSRMSVKEIESTIANYGYHIQAAFYRMGMRMVLNSENVEFVNIFVQTPSSEKSDVHCIASTMPEDTLQMGELEIKNAIENIKKYKELPTAEGFISDYQLMDGITDVKSMPLIGLPAWYRGL